MSIAEKLKNAAIQIYADAQERADEIQKKLSKLNEEQLKLDFQLQTLQRAHDRLLSFKASERGEYQCPRCWVRDEIRSNLRPIPGTADEDFFRCDRCDLELAFPA